jgi:hypothetical protein
MARNVPTNRVETGYTPQCLAGAGICRLQRQAVNAPTPRGVEIMTPGVAAIRQLVLTRRVNIAPGRLRRLRG